MMLRTNEANTVQIRIQIQQQINAITTITTTNSSSEANDGFLQ